MENSRERICPINPNCKGILPDGTCNGSCFSSLKKRAQVADQVNEDPRKSGAMFQSRTEDNKSEH